MLTLNFQGVFQGPGKIFNFQEFLGIPGVVGTLFHMLYMEDLQIICMSVEEIPKCDYSVEKY